MQSLDLGNAVKDVMESDFKPILFNMVNRWSALKMAVDHQMGGRLSGEKAIYLYEYLWEIFKSNSEIDVEDLEDVLTEYMENEFNTSLEDNSAVELSRALVHLFNIYKKSGLSAVENELRTLPPVTEWLDIIPKVVKIAEPDSSDEEPEVDPEWTTVSYKRR